jgi:tetratricopeptide (TPR) repeat protein
MQSGVNVQAILARARELEQAGDLPAAVRTLMAGLQERPDDPEILMALSAFSEKLGDMGGALALSDTARRTGALAARLHHAGLLERAGRPEDAARLLRDIAAEQPANPVPLLRLSYLKRRQSDYTAAAGICRHMLQAYPDLAAAWVSAAIGDYCTGDYEAADRGFRHALAIAPEDAVARFAFAANLLAMERWLPGFLQFEWRRRLPDAPPPPADLPAWQGNEPPGTKVLVWNDQALGDALQFLRYLPLIAARGHVPHLVLAPPLARMAEQVTVTGDPLPHCDVQLPLMSAASHFGLVGADAPYLHADPDQRAAWATRLKDLPGRKVGLVWAGEARSGDFQANLVDRRRSLPLKDLAPLLEVPGISWISLQKGKAAEQIAALPEQLRPHDWMAEMHDFADTAALVAELDLVVSVDTSVAHLAGGLGRPVWVLSRYAGCWRWPRHREDSAWYPSARVFHQEQPGRWEPVIGRLEAALFAFAGNKA